MWLLFFLFLINNVVIVRVSAVQCYQLSEYPLKGGRLTTADTQQDCMNECGSDEKCCGFMMNVWSFKCFQYEDCEGTESKEHPFYRKTDCFIDDANETAAIMETAEESAELTATPNVPKDLVSVTDHAFHSPSNKEGNGGNSRYSSIETIDKTGVITKNPAIKIETTAVQTTSMASTEKPVVKNTPTTTISNDDSLIDFLLSLF